jgi:hypothetical protein
MIYCVRQDKASLHWSISGDDAGLGRQPLYIRDALALNSPCDRPITVWVGRLISVPEQRSRAAELSKSHM